MMKDRLPCPDCGETKTLELMRYEVQRLRALKRCKERREAQKSAQNVFNHRVHSAGAHNHSIVAVGGSGGTGGADGSGGVWSTTTAPNIMSSGHSHTLGTTLNLGTSYGIGGLQITAGNGSNLLYVDDVPEIPDEFPDWNKFRAEMSGRVNGMECCIGCRRFYHPYVELEQEELQDEIDELRAEVLHPLEVLALEAA